jgi:hypothetical protein
LSLPNQNVTWSGAAQRWEGFTKGDAEGRRSSGCPTLGRKRNGSIFLLWSLLREGSTAKENGRPKVVKPVALASGYETTWFRSPGEIHVSSGREAVSPLPSIRVCMAFMSCKTSCGSPSGVSDKGKVLGNVKLGSLGLVRCLDWMVSVVTTLACRETTSYEARFTPSVLLCRAGTIRVACHGSILNLDVPRPEAARGLRL